MVARALIGLRPGFRRFPLVRVKRAPVLLVAGVRTRQASIMRFEGAVNSVLHPSALTTLQIPFGTLSEQRFLRLSAEFGGRSRVPFDPKRKYEVLDFLPPVVQAIVNLDIELPEPQVLRGSRGWDEREPDAELSVSLDTNCHGTAWSLARACRSDARQMLLFFGDMVRMDDALHGGRFRLIDTLAVGQLNLLGIMQLQPGDIVAFYEVSEWPRVTMLLHTAVHLGAGIFVDKPNTELPGEDSPYRLGTAEMIATPILEAVGSAVRAEVVRPRGPLPPAAEVFGSSYRQQLKDLARSTNRPIGMPIVPQFEYGLGGGIRSESLCGLATLPIEFGDSSRGRLAGISIAEATGG